MQLKYLYSVRKRLNRTSSLCSDCWTPLNFHVYTHNIKTVSNYKLLVIYFHTIRAVCWHYARWYTLRNKSYWRYMLTQACIPVHDTPYTWSSFIATLFKRLIIYYYTHLLFPSIIWCSLGHNVIPVNRQNIFLTVT